MKSWVLLNAAGVLYLYDVNDCCDSTAPDEGKSQDDEQAETNREETDQKEEV